MDPAEVLSRTSDLPDVVVRYGPHADAVIDLHLPPRPVGRPFPESPLVVLAHGGFWRSAYDRVHTRPLAQALAAEGFVVATPEYRRVGGEGELAGGWPTTFEDLTAVMTRLPGLLEELGVPVGRTTVMGHSAGGHLALWLANEPFAIDRVVGLAPVGDLRAAATAHTGGDAVPALLGGKPEEVPERYDATDPATRFETTPPCPVTIIHGVEDTEVPVENSRGLAARHPQVQLVELEGIEHYGLIDPLSPAWAVVRASAG